MHYLQIRVYGRPVKVPVAGLVRRSNRRLRGFADAGPGIAGSPNPGFPRALPPTGRPRFHTVRGFAAPAVGIPRGPGSHGRLPWPDRFSAASVVFVHSRDGKISLHPCLCMWRPVANSIRRRLEVEGQVPLADSPNSGTVVGGCELLRWTPDLLEPLTSRSHSIDCSLRPAGDTQRSQYYRDGVLDCLFGKPQALTDFPVGHTFADADQDLCLPRSQQGCQGLRLPYHEFLLCRQSTGVAAAVKVGASLPSGPGASARTADRRASFRNQPRSN